jgi:FMN-dependent NADH-azoreductase
MADAKRFILFATIPADQRLLFHRFTAIFALRHAGYKSLLSGKKVLHIYASAGDYRPGDPSDFQKPYLRRSLNFVGVTDIQEINVAPTLANPDVIGLVKCKAKRGASKS